MTDHCTQTWRRWQPRACSTPSVHTHHHFTTTSVVAPRPAGPCLCLCLCLCLRLCLCPCVSLPRSGITHSLLTFDHIPFPRSSDALVPSLFRPTMVCRYASTSTNELEKFP